MQNILTYSQNLTRVVSRGLMLDADERPELPFAFDALYYEPPTGLAFKVLAGEQLPLTDDEVAACETYCDSFLDSADYPVFALDESGVFAGSMRKSAAQAKGLAYRIVEAPEHPASKWSAGAWQRIAAAILDDGDLHLLPESVCDRCTLVFSAAEWEAFPHPPVAADGAYYKWDFAAEVWKDVSDPHVHGFDEVGAYIGSHQRSLLRDGWGYTLESPRTWAYKMTEKGWEKLAAVIYEDGHVEINPAGIGDDSLVLLTREEWGRWPARPAAERWQNWVWDFRREQWKDTSNAHGAAYEPDGERAGVLVGIMPRQEAMQNGFGWTFTTPDFQAAKWDGSEWHPVHAVIMDSGALRLTPSGVCQRCMLAFTKEEWDAFPHPPETPEELGEWTWNFAAEQWEDRRDLETMRGLAKYTINTAMLRVASHKTSAIWPDQVELTMAVHEIAHPDGDTPFLDAFVATSAMSRNEAEAHFKSLSAETAKIIATCAAQRLAFTARIGAALDRAALDGVFVDIKAIIDGLYKALV